MTIRDDVRKYFEREEEHNRRGHNPVRAPQASTGRHTAGTGVIHASNPKARHSAPRPPTPIRRGRRSRRQVAPVERRAVTVEAR